MEEQGTENYKDGKHMERRFITSETIRDLLRQGIHSLEIKRRDVITHDARETASRAGFLLLTPAERRPFVCANWKMNGDPNFALAFGRELLDWLAQRRDFEGRLDLAIAPPHALLLALLPVLSASVVQLAAQDGIVKDEGAFTGDVSLKMVKSCGARLAILGHSERRRYHGETAESIGQKLARALELDLTPVFCVGEKLEERESGAHEATVRDQLLGSLACIPPEKIDRLVVAYEPVWAIGTGRVAAEADIAAMHGFIRGVVAEVGGEHAGRHLRILYGGSVNARNSYKISRLPDVDGVLVGGASLKQDEFRTIIASFLEQ